jgi:hypothetical protein
MTTITFKLKDDEARLVRSLARQEKLTLSEYLRRRALLAAPKPKKIGRIRCAHTGSMIFEAPPDMPRLSTKTVRDLLADFP